jgi:competence ComEA-like helix-hairpin-helix protein
MVNNFEISNAMIIKLENELPPMPKFVEGIRRAPKRPLNLSKNEIELALSNALRYIPESLHEKLAPEFLEELFNRGRIYGYRYRPEGNIKAKPIKEYQGKCIEGKAFQVMIDNNLDFDVALYPYELVTYGETGQVCQNWMQYRLIKKYLEVLTEEQTLVVMSGHPLGLFRSSKNSPRVVITNALMVGMYDDQEHWIKAQALGVANYGQMTAGGWMYIGPQGIVHGTYNTLLNAGRLKLGIPQDGDLQGHLFVSSGLGGMSAAQAKAIEIANGVGIIAEVDLSRIKTRLEQGWLKTYSDDLDEIFKIANDYLQRKETISIGYYGTGCKVVALDELGKFLEHNTIFPVPPENEIEKSEKIVLEMIKKHKINLIVIGNGTASRETQQFIVDLIKKNKLDLKYIFVDESGASVYSASKLAKEEFPNLDVTIRGAISLGRRVQDPLAELVKIDPKSLGVGQYQHDVNQKKLKEKLDATVVSVVNNVGVNLNTASYSLLQYVSGITNSVAKKIVKYREENGPFSERKELFNIKGLGEKTFEQAAGFLRILDGNNPLEMTGIHPESYEITERLITILGFKIEDLKDKETLELIKQKISEILNNKENLSALIKELDVGEYTLIDILKELQKPGRDPRDEMPQPQLMDDILKFEDLKEGMKLSGKITNITDFGAFVDIGIKENGLIHKSNLSEKFVRHPSEVLEINDIVEVEILSIEEERKRIGLKLIEVKK